MLLFANSEFILFAVSRMGREKRVTVCRCGNSPRLSIVNNHAEIDFDLPHPAKVSWKHISALPNLADFSEHPVFYFTRTIR
jgi:hypothetical protein